ncbi:MAG: GIY-YIG nuclease family protein [Candidatus Kerfeldbacteria bacterium]|nr:GIY-YIG nuclease family protein [Candidatus Kerfeldbacteria bacterium]
MYTVYILACVDGTFYTGITNDLPKRWALHQAGKASRYTRSHPVKKIVYTKRCRTKSTALKRELQIKQLNRAEKIALISGDAILSTIS